MKTFISLVLLVFLAPFSLAPVEHSEDINPESLQRRAPIRHSPIKFTDHLERTSGLEYLLSYTDFDTETPNHLQ